MPGTVENGKKIVYNYVVSPEWLGKTKDEL